jgi:predicted SnoaL-like aldol condensation-catalyzing enzyme
MPQHPTAQIVADFYSALGSADADTLAAIIDAHFAEDAAIEWPPSLPHGGRVEGVRRVRGLFTRIAQAGNQAGATNLRLVRTIGDGDHVVAWVTFEWKNPNSDDTVTNAALEAWSFSDGLVREIRAFYWDTAAISAQGA